MATVESWVEGHEKICGDRYRLLMATIGAGWLLVVAVAGWGLLTVHEDQKAQMQTLQNISQQVSSQKPAPVTVQMNQRP